MPKTEDKYAFIVGKGALVDTVIASAKNQNLNFIIAGIKGYSDRLTVNKYNHFWFSMGQVENLLNQLKNNEINRVVLVGAIKRPSLFSLKIDSKGRDILKKYVVKGDNSLLSLLVSEFNLHGISVVGAHEIATEILAAEKLYVSSDNYQEYTTEIEEGFILAKNISQFDIGQSIIVQQGMVIAVEAVEGTKGMILRSKTLLKKEGSKGLLIKVKKINQTAKVDLPTIGAKTVIQAKKVGLAGIVIEAGSTLILQEKETLALAKKYNIFILSIQNSK